MKQISILLVLLLNAGCSNDSDVFNSTKVTVIDDMTGHHKSRPIADSILSLYDFPSDSEQDATFRYVLLTDKRLNPVQEISLANGNVSERQNSRDEPTYRDLQILNFYKAVRNAVESFADLYSKDSSLEYSECYATIASEMEILAASNANQKIIIIYSDLQENDDDFSCYSSDDMRLLIDRPNEVFRLLNKRHHMPANLKGVTVYLVYEPISREEDNAFGLMANFYKKILKVRGARVVVQAEGKYFHP